MKQREQIQEQVRELLDRAAAPIAPEDPMGMVNFSAMLVAAKMTSLVLQDDLEAAKQKEEQKTDE